jgi:hypothetical protein
MGQAFKLVLVPISVVTYRYRAKTYEALVNGSTGTVGGEPPMSASEWARSSGLSRGF